MAYFGDATEAKRLMDGLNISAPALSGILGGKPSASGIAAWLNGSGRMDSERAKQVLRALRSLAQFQSEAAPLPLDFGRHIELWRVWLRKLDERDDKFAFGTHEMTITRRPDGVVTYHRRVPIGPAGIQDTSVLAGAAK